MKYLSSRLARPASLLMVLLAALPLAARADDPIVASTTARLSGLTYQLIDLTPNDGIAPSVQFSFPNSGSLSATGYSGADSSDVSTAYSFNGFQSAPVSAATPSGNFSASVGPSSMETRAIVPLSAFVDQIDAMHADPSSSGSYVSYGGTGYAVLRSPYDPELGIELPSVTLSANTALLISGTASLNSTMDYRSLQASLGALGVSSLYVDSSSSGSNINGNASLNIDVFDAAGNPTGWGSSSSSTNFNMPGFDGFTGQTLNSDLALSETPVVAQYDSGGMLFSLHLVNTTATTQSGMLDITMSSQVLGNLSPTFVDVIPPPPVVFTPEPSTYVLAGLGLLSAAGVARRRRCAA